MALCLKNIRLERCLMNNLRGRFLTIMVKSLCMMIMALLPCRLSKEQET